MILRESFVSRCASPLIFVLTCALGITSACSNPGSPHVQTYQGMCDGSAAVAIGPDFFAVANDEDSVIRVYRRDHGGPPAEKFDLSGLLDLKKDSPETDIEGAAPLGDRVYWITSHARNSEGKERPSRRRFFATRFQVETGRVALHLVGKPYKDLIKDLAATPDLKRFNFAAAAKLAPKDRGGLNIEGLAATPDNRLLIAFRNPVPQGRALLLPLLNPDGLVSGEKAKFGEPILLDLGGLGIRDIAAVNGRYLIAAGAYAGGKGEARLFLWDGQSTRPELVRSVDLRRFNPEAIVVYPTAASAPASQIQILSDDGSGRIRGTDCSDLKDDSAKRFRALGISLDVP